MAGKNIARFKTQERGQRVQTAETTFVKGMYFSDMPLAEGFVKGLINYDMKDQGTVLLPRAGLRTIEHAAHTGDVAYTPATLLSYAKMCAEENGESYKQFIMGELSETKLTGTDLYLGTGYVGTGFDDGTLNLNRLNTSLLEGPAVPAVATAVAQPAGLNSYTVTRVIDGDTIELTYGGILQSVRLIGVDTPETVSPTKPVEPYGAEASAYTTAQLLNVSVALEFDETQRDVYGRLLAYVWKGGTLFNDTLLRLGYAKTSVFLPNVKYLALFAATEKEAKKRQMGLWGLDNAESFVLFKKPLGGEIHGVAVEDLPSVGRQVGTFAYNDDFYYFKDNGKLFRTNFDETLEEYEVVAVAPRFVDIREAGRWGYNMLAPKPYNFENLHGAPNIQLLGIAPYDEDGQILLSPLVNQPVTLRAQYNVVSAVKYTIVWEWKEYGNPTWQEFKRESVTFSADTAIFATFSAAAENVIFRVRVYRWAGSPLAEGGSPEQEFNMLMAFKKDMLGETYNLKPQKYNLHTATGMTFWKRRLVVYGVREARTTIFLSDVDDPEYFPYPNNIDVFDEPIIHVTPLREDLLVFTTSQVYSMVLSPDGTTWTRHMIQDKLRINEWDVHLIQTIRNMVYFRSGDYYYMIVPSTRAGGLAVAPISKNMEAFFNKFQINVAEMVRLTYDYRDSLTLVNYYNYVDFEDVCNVYVYQTTKGVYLNFVLLYNTLQRSWRAYIYESQNMLIPFKEDVTKKGELVSLFELDSRPAIQILGYNTQNIADYYIPTGLATLDNVDDIFKDTNKFKNYQYLDSGYRDLDSTFKKRFREAQIKFYNTSRYRLNFYTDFFIDGDLRVNNYIYKVNHNVDPLDPNYGIITMDRELIEPWIVPGTTILDVNAWQLDVSLFPDLSLWKVRLPVSGKGYTPRLRLISYNEQVYELLDLNWVFRPLYSR